MIFRHGFFHGDPHPANILLLDDGRIGLVDFGLAGRLTDEDMTRLTRLFIDAATENVDAIPRRLAELGLRYPKEREEELRDAIEELFYRYYGSSLSSIDPIEVIREGLDLIYSLNLRLPSRFVILDKAIATLGAVGVELYPDFNVFEVARPYARRLLAERFSPRRMALRAQTEVRELGGVARELPYQLRDVMEQTRQGKLEIQIRNPGFDDLTYHIDHAVNRIAVALIVLGGLVGSSIVGVLAKNGPHVDGPAPALVRRLRALRHLRRLARLGDRPVGEAVGATRRRPASAWRHAAPSAARAAAGAPARARAAARGRCARRGPSVSTAAQRALSTASSVASTAAAKSGSRWPSGTTARSTRSGGRSSRLDRSPSRRRGRSRRSRGGRREPVRARPSPARRASALELRRLRAARRWRRSRCSSRPEGAGRCRRRSSGTPARRRCAGRGRSRSSRARARRPSRRPRGRARLDDPMPPFQPNATMPVPAPTHPCSTAPSRAAPTARCGVRRLDLDGARVVQPAVVALADDRDHDVVDADCRIGLARDRRRRRRRRGRPPSSR